EPRDDAGLHPRLADPAANRVPRRPPAGHPSVGGSLGPRRRHRPVTTSITTNRTLAKAGLVVSGAFLVSALLGWVRYILIVNTLPAHDVDPFLAASRRPDTIFQLVAAGALSSAMIPIVSALLASKEEARAVRVITTVTNLMLAALLLLGSMILVFAPSIVPAITPGFPPDQIEQEIQLTRI